MRYRVCLPHTLNHMGMGDDFYVDSLEEAKSIMAQYDLEYVDMSSDGGTLYYSDEPIEDEDFDGSYLPQIQTEND